GADLEDAGEDDVTEAFSDAWHLLDHEAEGVEGGRQGDRGAAEGCEVGQPRKRNAHGSSDLAHHAHVVVEKHPHAGNLMAHPGASVDLEPEGESRPLLR